MDKCPDHANLTGFTCANEFPARNIVRRHTPMGANLDNFASLPSRVDHGPSFLDRVADGLLHINVSAGFHGGNSYQRMPMIRRGDDANLRLLFIQECPEVAIFLWSITKFLLHTLGGGIGLTFVDIAYTD